LWSLIITECRDNRVPSVPHCDGNVAVEWDFQDAVAGADAVNLWRWHQPGWPAADVVKARNGRAPQVPVEIDETKTGAIGEQLRAAFMSGVILVVADVISTALCHSHGLRHFSDRQGRPGYQWPAPAPLRDCAVANSANKCSIVLTADARVSGATELAMAKAEAHGSCCANACRLVSGR
jgi:hypothetical protein